MLGIYVSVPVACFRKGLAREYLETEPIPPPATCYGFLLSFVGEIDRRRHLGCRVTSAIIGNPATSVVLRTVWRVKKTPLGSAGNTRPDYQQLLSGVELLVWLDSQEEKAMTGPSLETRIEAAFADPASVTRFGGLSLGESTHLVDQVKLLSRATSQVAGKSGRIFLTAPRGKLTLPVWVDHVGSARTRFATGNLVETAIAQQPEFTLMPRILPEYEP